MKKIPCSYKHFDRLLKSFKRMALKQIDADMHIEKYSTVIERLFDGSKTTSPFDSIINDLGKTYKKHPFKTHSCQDDVMFHELVNKFWVSYTFENENKKRINNNDYGNTYIVFKIFMQIGNYRKKRIARWSVKIDWL